MKEVIRFVIYPLLIQALVCAGQTAKAADRHWNSPVGGLFGEPANWVGGFVPQDPDLAIFGIASKYQVDLTDDTGLLGINVRAGELTIDLGDRSLLVTSRQYLGDGPWALVVGQEPGDIAALTLRSGELVFGPEEGSSFVRGSLGVEEGFRYLQALDSLAA
jgi:hypothetical protein